MKNLFNALMALCLMMFSVSAVSAQNDSKSKTIDFKVTGNCWMCKKTIESSLKDKPGIKSAVWNKDTKMMKVVFDPAKISEDQIHQKIADSGYDTEKKKRSDKAYNSLNKCCQYKRTIEYKN
jgi:periplasmic mercuric ion binding protein